ncbi:MAG TPA: metal-dependent transcriptional regulator [Tepidisphaeraceae bacterium]|nr:metal-dependent transcriptional regulator [Tepidisphaeraceae bacterium]
MPTSTVENYLKQLYMEQHSSDGGRVAMGRLATAMGVVPGTATSMVKALADSGLVEYEPRGGVRLTSRGEQLALHVLRRHRLVELFLVKVLGLDWSEVHIEAESLEHAISDRVLERIDAYLGHPKTDPHGDPIPSPKGQMEETAKMNLADCAVGVEYKIARVLDQGPEFLKFVQRRGLTPGASVTVEQREAAAQAVKIRAGKEEVLLGLAAAGKILVEARIGGEGD